MAVHGTPAGGCGLAGMLRKPVCVIAYCEDPVHTDELKNALGKKCVGDRLRWRHCMWR